MRSWIAAVVGVAWGSLAGCSGPALPPPVLERVERPFAFNGDDELVTIHGRNFFPVVALDAWRGGADVDKSWSAWLVGPKGEGEIALERPLLSVGMLDDTELAATVAQGMPPGLYDVQVESPSGARAVLASGFTVTDTRAEALSLSAVDGVVHPITELVAVRIQVVDLAGEVVPVPFDVSVGATLEGGGDVTVAAGTLAPSESTPDGKGVVGTLVDGEGTVFVQSPSPGRVTVVATPLEPDSAVARAALDLAFQPGDDLSVAIRLPFPADPVPEVVAGEPLTVEAELVDQYGNPSEATLSVVLLTECSAALPVFAVLDGPTPVTITPKGVTTDDCPLDKIVVWDGPGGPAGASAQFTVRAGDATQFDVGLVGGLVQAGDAGTFTVIPRDANDNDTAFGGPLTFTLSTGAAFAPICGDGPFPGWLQCIGQLTAAGRGQTLEVTGTDLQTPITGRSDPFDVVPDDVPMMLEIAIPAAGPAAAGQPFVVEVTTRDAWGNVMDPASLAADPVVVTDELGEIACLADRITATGAQALDCTLFTARDAAVLTATRAAAGLQVTSLPVEVVNGDLAVVEVLGPVSVVAGAVTVLQLTGADAFGNPYLAQDDPVVTLTDDSGTLSLPSATLGADGSVVVPSFFTRAGSTAVYASQGGVALGQSAPIQVLAGATSALALRPAAPWAWVGEPLEIQVEAVDAFGNRTEFAGTATLTSTTTSAPAVAAPLVNGVGASAFTWSAASFDEALGAAAGAFVGQVAVPVSARCVGPVAQLDFGGWPEAVACTDPLDDTATIVADLSASSQGPQPLVGYAIAEVGGALATGANPVLAIALHGTGRHDLLGLVHDASGCGAEVAAAGWTGPDDGRAVGPIPLSTAAIAPTVFDTITVDVTGVGDCARDPAAYAEIEVRATGGEPTASPTGTGLVIALDGAGDASVPLVMSGGMSAGDVEVHATAPEDGCAGGLLVVPVTQDNVLPTVVAQDPSGLTAETVSSVLLTFSEPLRPVSVTSAAWAVLGPELVTVTPTLLAGDQEVLLTLTPPVDAAVGAYTVVVPNSVRDVAGNRLDGNWSGGAADYLGAFGAAGATPAAVTCAGTVPSALVLRPDGDPGVDAEADELAVTVTGAQAPAWWVVEVRDAADALVWQTWRVPAGATDTLTWAARDRRGMVVPNGVYGVTVAPDDGLGNRGSGCEVAVTVDNPLGAP